MIFDFLFRRGNPTNPWRREPGLNLIAELALPALSGVTLGSPCNKLSFLGRSSGLEFGTLCYYDLGIGIACAPDGTLKGFTIVLADEFKDFQPYQGKLLWHASRIRTADLQLDRLQDVFGEWYWLDQDETELLAFYEYPSYEMQIELTLSGAVKRIDVTREPLLAQADQRELYQVDQPWPPESYRT